MAGATLPLLAGLVDQSLVAVGENGRYSMHELLRQYAAEGLAADPADEQATRERHAEHYAALLPGAAEAATRDDGDLDVEVVDKLNAANKIEDRAERDKALAKIRAEAPASPRRLFAGKNPDRSATVALSDAAGKPRLTLTVDAAGNPRIEFLDEAGKVVSRLPQQ